MVGREQILKSLQEVQAVDEPRLQPKLISDQSMQDVTAATSASPVE